MPTEQPKTERQRGPEQQLSVVLSEFARTMATDFPIQGILDHLVGRIVEILPVTAAGVTLIAPGMNPLYVAASNDAALRYEKVQTELGEGPCLMAYQSGEPVSVPDLRDDDRFPAFAARALTAGMHAVFTFPLRHGENPLGSLDLYRETPGALSDEAMAAAQTLADVAAAYLLNAQARSDLQDASDRSRELSLHDGLTGLPNRMLLLERLEHAFSRGRRTGKISAVLFVDLDRFKSINDTYGHGVGDELLVALADRLSALLRPHDTVARLHGDEFVILCEDVETHAQAAAIGSRLEYALARPFVLPSVTIGVTASVGIAFADHDVHTPEQVLREADAAMYQAKRLGGDRHQVFDPGYRHLADGHSGLERELHGALQRGELHTEYQPIVAADDGRITGFEALLRWAHPDRGLVTPTMFIPLAEQSGLMSELGQWVLGQGWAARHGWQRRQQAGALSMSVNVSTQQLMSAGFAESVASVLGTVDAGPQLLTLDITESIFIRDRERALVVLSDLKDIGVMIALDDFGTGYSSLNYLNQFPVDIVKVDGSFVADLARNPASRVIVGAVVQLAHTLAMTVVAEGVETAEQYRQVTELGCDLCQGFYFAPPMTAAAVDDLIRRGPSLPLAMAR